MKKLFALLISFSMLLSVVPMVSYANDTKTLDELIGNELANGTFEKETTDEWEISEDSSIVLDTQNTNVKSAKSAKISGTVTTSVTLYRQELYDFSIWLKPVSGDATVTVKITDPTVGDITVINGQQVSTATAFAEKVRVLNPNSLSKKGAKLNEFECTLSITVTAPCYIDDVILKESEEKILNAQDGWTVIGTDVVSYDSTNDVITFTNTKNAQAVQYMALEYDCKYKMTAEVLMTTHPPTASNQNTEILKIYWSDQSGTLQKLKYSDMDVDESTGWATITSEFTNIYPSSGSDGDMAGLYFTIGATFNTTYSVRNVSVIKDTNAKVAAPAIDLSISKGDGKVTPSYTTGHYYVYKYLVNDVVALSGFGSTIPEYDQIASDFSGTVKLEVTPVNSEGTYGETKTDTATYTYTPPKPTNNGVSGLDEVLENKIINGTFENALPTWTLSGLEITKEINETATNTSFTSAKLVGNGTITINPTIYGNELYDASIFVKPISASVNIALKADFGNGLEYTIFEDSADVQSWTKLSGNLLRFVGTAYKNGDAVTASPVLTLSVDGDCYIDEFMLTPAENLLISSDDIRVMGENDGTEVGGWYIRGTATAEVVTDGVKVSNTNGINNCIAQYVVLDKNSTYTLTANLKATDASSDDKCTVYGAYSGAKYENVTISDGGVAFEKTIDLSTKNLPDVIASCVAFTDADMSVTNASLIKDLKYTAPEAATASIPAAVVQGNSVQGSAEAVFDDGDGVGYIYCYKLDGKNVGSGFAVNDTIPAITAPEPAGDTGELTLTVVPVNSEGTIGVAVTSQVCTVSGSYVATHSSVSSSSFTAGNTVSLGVNVANNTDEPQKIVVIAAYYEGGRMLSCDLVEKTITNGLNEDYDLNVILPATNVNGGGTFNVFVWKGYDGNTFSMEPVCEVINPVTN